MLCHCRGCWAKSLSSGCAGALTRGLGMTKPDSRMVGTLGLRPSYYPRYFTDLDPVNLGDLGLRHSVVCQGTNATELGSWNVKRRAFGDGPLFDRFWFRRDNALFRLHWHHRRDHKDAGLAPGLFFGRAGAVQPGRRHLPRRRLRLEQIFRVLTRSVDPLAITMIGRPWPCG